MRSFLLLFFFTLTAFAAGNSGNAPPLNLPPPPKPDAPPPAPPAQPGQPGANGQPPPPAPPAQPPVNRALGWNAGLKNDGLFNSNVSGGTYAQGTAFSDAMGVHQTCLLTNMNGRTDGICATNPDYPECAGIARSVGNMSTCVEYYNNDPKLGCKKYGSAGYSAAEWYTIGSQFAGAYTGCQDVATQTTNTSPDLNGYNDVLGRSEADLPDQKGIDRNSGNLSGGSSIGGKSSNDGSSSLGLKNGDISQRLKSGDSFHEIVSGSPFLKSLKPNQRQEILDAESNKSDLVASIQEKMKSTEGAPGGKDIAAISNPNQLVEKSKTANTDSQSYSLSGGRATANKVSSGSIPNSELKRSVASADTNLRGSPIPDKLVVASPQAKLEEGKAAVLAPGAIQGATDTDIDTTIFFRVHVIYKYRAPSLVPNMQSETSRAINSLEKPKIFQEL